MLFQKTCVVSNDTGVQIILNPYWTENTGMLTFTRVQALVRLENDILEYENRVWVQINKSVCIQKGNNRKDRRKSWALKSVESDITLA